MGSSRSELRPKRARCRMLRRDLEHLERPEVSGGDLLKFLRRVEVFLSHSKHDEDGSAIALQFRQFVQDAGYDAFFDVFNIPIGLRFNRVLLEKVRVSALVAIHTDTYSTREWCRHEMIEAKLFNVPLVIADCIKDTDERGRCSPFDGRSAEGFPVAMPGQSLRRRRRKRLVPAETSRTHRADGHEKQDAPERHARLS
jgi:hypothetical protein